jgi:thiol-disulfide isomerase/thioredoxin
MLLITGLAGAGELSEVAPPIEAPALALPDLEGVPHHLDDYRGRVVLVNFWATWCLPCLREMPGIKRLQEVMAGRPFQVLAVNVEESERRIRGFKERLDLDFVMLRDGSGRAFRTWKVRVFPTSYLIDPQGRIRFAAVGPIEWDSEEAVQAVEGLLP